MHFTSSFLTTFLALLSFSSAFVNATGSWNSLNRVLNLELIDNGVTVCSATDAPWDWAVGTELWNLAGGALAAPHWLYSLVMLPGEERGATKRRQKLLIIMASWISASGWRRRDLVMRGVSGNMYGGLISGDVQSSIPSRTLRTESG